MIFRQSPGPCKAASVGGLAYRHIGYFIPLFIGHRERKAPALRLANCESDIAISASQAIEGTVITAAAAPGWISWANLGSGTHAARALSASITRAGIW